MDVKKLKERLPGLCHIVAGLSPRMYGFNPRPVQVGFVVNNVTVILLQVLWFFPVSIIPPMLQTHSPIMKTVQSPPVDSVVNVTHFRRMLAIKENDKTHQLII